MKIQDIRIGQRVRDIEKGWEMTVVGVGVINLDMDSPYVYTDFEGNEGEMWEYTPEELEPVRSIWYKIERYGKTDSYPYESYQKFMSTDGEHWDRVDYPNEVEFPKELIDEAFSYRLRKGENKAFIKEVRN